MHDARRLAAVLEPVIGAVYFAPEVHDAFESLGYGGSSGTFGGVAGPNMEAYFCSRAASMGQVSGAVAAAAFGVFNPVLVEPVVDGGWKVDAATLATARVEAVASALARVIGPADATVARTADLLERGAQPLAATMAGAAFLGIGARTEYRQDTVTVYLRAVSVRTGEVLTNVTASKTIASQAFGANAYRFVAFRELLEAEVGITSNEPDQVALQQAIEKAVYGLVLEGVDLGLWRFADMASAEALMSTYRAERDGIYDARDVQNAVQRAGSLTALTIVDGDDEEDEGS